MRIIIRVRSWELFDFKKLEIYKRAFFFLLLIILSELLTPNFELTYAQNAKLNVPADVTTQTVILDPQTSGPTAVEGRLYYDNTNNQPYYYNGVLPWRPFGAGGSRTVATKIVAVRRSPDDPALDSDLMTNKTADYICNGSDDQAEINSAINALGATGGAVYLLEGTYNISGAINLSSNTALIGSGRGTVLKAVTGTNIINATNVSNILITQLVIDGNKQGTKNHGIYFNQVTNSQIKDVWAENMSGTGLGGPETGGIFFNDSDNNIISGNYLRSNGYAGIFLTAYSNNNNLLGNNIQSSECDGIYLMNSSNNTVSGNITWTNGCDGIYLRESSNNTISGNNSQLSTRRGILIEQDSSNNTVSGNIVYTSTLDGIGFMSGAENNTVSGNNVMFNKQNGILVEKSSNNAIFANTIYDNGGTGDYNAINVTGNSDDNLISSNLLFDSAGTGYPINISSSSTNNYLVSNFIASWPASNNTINDAGTNTRYTDKIKLTLEPAAACPGAGCSNDFTADNQTLTPIGPTSYLQLAPTASRSLNGTKAIEDGRSAGDVLILENTTANTVTIPDDANVKLDGNRSLGQNDTLTLLWNGTDWIETGFVANN